MSIPVPPVPSFPPAPFTLTSVKGLSAAVWERLSEGQPLSKAMEQMPQVFDRQTISLVRAAEATGSLNEVMQRLIAHHTEQRALRQKLINALIYPVFVCIVAFGVILFFVLFLMPRLQTLLSSLGSKLPMATQLLVTSAELCAVAFAACSSCAARTWLSLAIDVASSVGAAPIPSSLVVSAELCVPEPIA